MARATTPKKKPYKISITMGRDTFTSEGYTGLEALQNLKRPVKIFTKVIARFTSNGITRSTTIMPQKAKRLWWKNAQPILAKSFERGLLGVK